MENIGGKDDQISGLQPQLKRSVGKLGTHPGVRRVHVGVGPVAGVKEAQQAALRLFRDRLAPAYAVDRRPGGQRMVMRDEGARVAADVKPRVIGRSSRRARASGVREVASRTVCSTPSKTKRRSAWTQLSGQRNRLKRLSKVSSWGIWLGVGLRYSSWVRSRKSFSSSALRRSAAGRRALPKGTAKSASSCTGPLTSSPVLPGPGPRNAPAASAG